MKKTIKSAFSILLCILMSASLPLFAYANDNVISLTADDMSNGYSLKFALYSANYSDGNTVVNLPSGEYNIDYSLAVYSNTYLHLNNDTKLNLSRNVAFYGTNGEVLSGYNGFSNITIEGGIWDCQNSKICAFRFAHGQNITLINMTFQNNIDNHLVECAAINNLVVENCIFKNSVRTGNGTSEALQLDIIHNDEHFTSYGAFDDTPCANVRVSSCTFDNVPSGVCTRSAVIGVYFNNINIVGNKFSNIAERAIVCFNYKNSNISGNTISAAAGIEFKYMNGSNISKCFYMPNEGVVSSVNSNASSSINGNTIKIKSTSLMGDACGIMVYGKMLKSDTDGIVKNDYSINNINLYNNDISVSGNGKGVVLNGVKSSKFTLATVKMTGYKNGANYNNVSMNECSDVRVRACTINGAAKHGICVYNNSKHIIIEKSTISNCYKYGIYVEKGSTITEYPNTFKKCKSGNILLASKKTSNNTKKTSLTSVKKKGKAIKLTYKKVSGVSYKIYRAYSKNGDYKIIKTTSKTSYTDKSVKKSEKYYYKVRTVKKVNSSLLLSAYSSPKSAKA